MGLFSETYLFKKFIVTVTFVGLFLLPSVASSSKGHFNNDIKRGSRNFAESFVPIQPIPETNLFTGIYYKVGLKRFSSGWITWTEKRHKPGGWNYVQVDGRSDHAANYDKSGVWYNDIQWFFVPSDTEKGWYTLRNRQLPDTLATWSKSEFTSGSDTGTEHYIILNRNADPTDPDSLWKPIFAESNEGASTEYFQLKIKSQPEGIVSWTWEEYGGKDSHYIQVDLGDSNNPSSLDNYKKNNDWYEDTLFSFESLERELIGEIIQLEMQLFPKLEEVRSLTQTDCDNVPATIFINVEPKPLSRPLKQEVLNQGELILKFLGPLSEFPLMKIGASHGHISPSWYANSVEFQTVKHEYYSNEDIRLTTLEHGSVNTYIIVPPWSTTEVRICREFIDTSEVEEDIDVNIFLEISERSYRPSNAGKKFEAVYTNLPAHEFAYRSVESLMNVTRLMGSLGIDERWGLMSASSDAIPNEYFEVAKSGLKILGLRESDLVIIAAGSVKGRFGYRPVVASN